MKSIMMAVVMFLLVLPSAIPLMVLRMFLQILLSWSPGERVQTYDLVVTEESTNKLIINKILKKRLHHTHWVDCLRTNRTT